MDQVIQHLCSEPVPKVEAQLKKVNSEEMLLVVLPRHGVTPQPLQLESKGR